MDWYKKIKKYYEDGIYTIEQVKVFVQAKKITEEEFKTITGQDYIVEE